MRFILTVVLSFCPVVGQDRPSSYYRLSQIKEQA